MAGGFIWYELMTPDPAAAKGFYDAVVGWDIATDPVAPGLEYRMIGRSDGGIAGGVMTLGEEMLANGARPVWLPYLHVEDVDATAAAIVADGGGIMMAPWDQPGVGRLAMVTDPSGAPFYLMAPMPSEGEDGASDVFSPDKAQHVRWNELSSADQDGSIDFYARHFGWVQEGAMPMGEMGEYKFLHHDGTAIGAVMKKPEEMPASAWTLYVGVEDIDRAERAIREGGGTVVQPPIEIPGGEFSLVATDPHGALFGLVGPRH